MGVFGECTVCAERLAGTDGAVRILCIAVECDIVSGADDGGQGGGDRLGGMHVCRLNERQQVDLLSCRLCGRAVVFLCLTVICVDLFVERIKDDAVLGVPCRLRGIAVRRTGG